MNVTNMMWPFLRGVIHHTRNKFQLEFVYQTLQYLLKKKTFEVHISALHGLTNFEFNLPPGVSVRDNTWVCFEDIRCLFCGLRNMYAYQDDTIYKLTIYQAADVMEQLFPETTPMPVCIAEEESDIDKITEMLALFSV